MVSRAADWLRQARRDLEHAARSIELGHFEWACFAAQQAAEKALKAVYQRHHMEVWGHSILRLLESLPEPVRRGVDEALLDCARELDKYYIPTRYPNSFSEGSPLDYFTRENAAKAVKCAEAVVRLAHEAVQA